MTDIQIVKAFLPIQNRAGRNQQFTDHQQDKLQPHVFDDRYGLEARKREELAVKRPGEPLFRQLSGESPHPHPVMPGQAGHDVVTRRGGRW